MPKATPPRPVGRPRIHPAKPVSRHPCIRALIADRRARKESRHAQSLRLGIRESSLRSFETARHMRRGTELVIREALGRAAS